MRSELEITNLLADYSKTLSLLGEYDNGKLRDTRGVKTKFVLDYKSCQKIIAEVKRELIVKKEAGSLFGQERGGSFEGIIRGLYQTFGKKELYPTIEDKAAHLLYLIIKDHPFSDGNKRSAAFLFVYFLDRSSYLFKKSGERKINDNALVALTLLVAESDPKEKEVMVKIIKNLITR
ncbi:MAG: Fic family protein [Patescibacteria group bacterium]